MSDKFSPNMAVKYYIKCAQNSDIRGQRPNSDIRGQRPNSDIRGQRPNSDIRGQRPNSDIRGQRPTSHEAENRSGGLVEASF